MRSAVGEPSFVMNWPAAHSVHAVQEAMLAALEKVPLAHGSQVWFWVALPFVLTDSPVAHSVHRAQAVTGLAS